jgi:hypothetical protein
MANVKQQSRSVQADIEAMMKRHFGGRPRRIDIRPDKDFEGEDMTRIEIHLDRDEASEAATLFKIRQDFGTLEHERRDLIAPQLVFKVAPMADAAEERARLAEDVKRIRKLIENLAP